MTEFSFQIALQPLLSLPMIVFFLSWTVMHTADFFIAMIHGSWAISIIVPAETLTIGVYPQPLSILISATLEILVTLMAR